MNQKKNELFRVIKFTLFSASAAIIQATSFALLHEVLRWDYWVCYLLSLVLSVLWNFIMNRKVTFRSANHVPMAMLKVAAFYVVFTPLSTWAGNWLNGIGWNEYLVLGVSMLSNFVLEFLYQRFFVFGKSIDSAVKK